MKDKNYASFIITNINSKENYKKLETYILDKFEYSEIIILYNKNTNIEKLKNELSPKSDNVLLLNLGENYNEDMNIKAGLEFSKGDIIFVLKDLNIENMEEYLDNLYEENKNGIDLCSLIFKYNTFKDKIFNLLLPNINNAYDLYFLCTRRIINAISECGNTNIPISYIIRNLGYNYSETNYNNKNYKLSQKNRGIYLLLYYQVIYKITLRISIFCSLVALGGGIYSLILKIFKFQIVNGWASTFTFLSFCFTFVFLIFSIIIRFLGLLFVEVNSMPIYKVIQINKL